MVTDASDRIRRGVPSAAGPFVAVAASLNRRYDQWHTGIVYRDVEHEILRFLHLAWDRELVTQNLDDEELGWEQTYVWVELPVPAEKARAIAQLCRRIALRVTTHGQEVRYAIRHHLGRFDSVTGAYVADDREKGLTCATCVMAVCRGVEVELVDVATWPKRAEDQAWVDRIVAALRRQDSEHADKVAQDGLCARFRPVEVTGACLSPALKVPCAEAVRAATIVAQRYEALFADTPGLRTRRAVATKLQK